ncbi:MAG: S8 family serine peptidase [Actinomycetales bacterium]
MTDQRRSPNGRVRGRATENFLIAKDERLSPMSFGPVDFGWVIEQLERDRQVRVSRVLRPRSLALQSFGDPVVRDVVAAEMPPETAAQLAEHPQLIVEVDHPIFPVPALLAPEPPAFVAPFGVDTTWHLVLRSRSGVPVVGATVYLYGSGVPAQGRTDATGSVRLTLTNETDASLTALYVNPAQGSWSLWLDRPELTSAAPNTVVLEDLSETFPAFPARQLLGWGQTCMGLDRLPAGYDGQGVRVGVIDSGAAAATHPDLREVRHGIDVTVSPADPTTWTTDTIAHGSHCTGVIAGADGPYGIRGFAPAAEVHEARIFPGGRLSSLLDALDYCIDAQLDVVNMSLGTGGSSQIVLQKLAQAKAQGVACIVAAGNSAGPVQFPGVSPDVLTVAAIGKEGTFPESSYHARQRWTGGPGDQDYFSAQFSCHGPEVDVCAPGVAIVSSVPPDGFAAWDGTSMAAPHISGLAALILAHHPDFTSGPLALRTAARVDRLFEIIKRSATPLAFGADRAGSGLPSVVSALLSSPDDQSLHTPSNAQAIQDSLHRLVEEMILAGLLRA